MGRIGRRAFLIGGAGIAALGAGAGGALLAPFAPLRGCRFLTAAEAAAALALAKTIFDEPAAPPLDGAQLLSRLDAAVGDLHPETRRLFKTGLRALEYAPLPRFYSRFSQLDGPRRAACIRSWERRPYLAAAALLSLRFQVGMAYFESDAALAACGWRPGCTPSGAEN